MINTTYPMTLADGTLNGEPIPRDWMAEAELAREVAEMTGDEVATWRTLLAAISSHMPIVIVHRRRDGRRERKTVMATYALVSPGQGRVRVEQWGGFTYEVFTSELVSVATPDVEYDV